MNKTWIEISESALSSNFKTLRALLDENTRYCSVVKSNAYGHGLKEIVTLQYNFGLKTFAVDSLFEAIEVQKIAKDADIFILGYTIVEDYKKVIEHGFTQNVYQKETLIALSETSKSLGIKSKVNIKIETGTQRQGVTMQHLPSFIQELQRNQNYLELVGVSSHFANIEDIHNPSFSQFQQQQFEQSVQYIYDSGLNPQCIHMACSAAGIYYPETHYSMARFGIAQYGLWSSESLRRTTVLGSKNINLKPVLSWKTRIAQLKDVPTGQPIGYGLSFITDRPMRIAVLPIGYYDGYKRIMGNGRAHVLINGHKCRVVGNVCMNMCMVDVSHLPKVDVHDMVTLVGRDGMHNISIEDIADWCNTINYEAVTQISAHIPKIIV